MLIQTKNNVCHYVTTNQNKVLPLHVLVCALLLFKADRSKTMSTHVHHCILCIQQRENMLSNFPRNSEVFVSEFLENLKDMLLIILPIVNGSCLYYYGHRNNWYLFIKGKQRLTQQIFSLHILEISLLFQDPDYTANDGVYSSSFTSYKGNGQYDVTVKVSRTKHQNTATGVQSALVFDAPFSRGGQFYENSSSNIYVSNNNFGSRQYVGVLVRL